MGGGGGGHCRVSIRVLFRALEVYKGNCLDIPKNTLGTHIGLQLTSTLQAAATRQASLSSGMLAASALEAGSPEQARLAHEDWLAEARPLEQACASGLPSQAVRQFLPERLSELIDDPSVSTAAAVPPASISEGTGAQIIIARYCPKP